MCSDWWTSSTVGCVATYAPPAARANKPMIKIAAMMGDVTRCMNAHGVGVGSGAGAGAEAGPGEGSGMAPDADRDADVDVDVDATGAVSAAEGVMPEG